MRDAVAAIDIMAGGSEDPREAELRALRGEKVADSIEDDPRFAGPGNRAGSFEALMGGWAAGSHGRALDTREVTGAGG